MTGMGDVVLVEEVPDLGVAVVVGRYGPRVRVAVDPAVVDVELLEVVLSIYGG